MTVKQEVWAILKSKGKTDERIKDVLNKCGVAGVTVVELHRMLIEEEYNAACKAVDMWMGKQKILLNISGNAAKNRAKRRRKRK